MKTTVKLAVAAVLGASGLAFTAGDAAAAIACNASGECWHIHRSWAYPAEAGVVIHPDGWKWATGGKFVWRDHPGRGYWRNGVWVRF